MTKVNRRSPVVVVLGHVDHGKTSLLDYIRKTNKAAKEHGGITQAIGAYEAEIDTKDFGVNKITFIDTPGHEVFTKLRSRGAEVADIAILIVDAVDSVMPQTIESIFHINNAKIPCIVAINKTDLPGADVEKVKRDLVKNNLLIEGMGGDIPVAPISAKTGLGVPELLEMILFISDLKEFSHDPDGEMKAYIIEVQKDKSGIIVSAIIKNGSLKVTQEVYAGPHKAKIKALLNDRGESIKEVIPSMPFVLLGFKDMPDVGIPISTTPPAEVEKITENKISTPHDFFAPAVSEKLKLIIKTDTQGSLDAISTTLQKNENVEISLAAVGEINKSDIFLARLNKAIVIGFGVTVGKEMINFAEQEKVVIKTYSLIYELIDELTEVSDLLAEKEIKEKQIKGEAKIMANFIIEKENIAGIKILKGKVNLGDQIELYRNDKLVGTTKIVSLKMRAKDVTEIKKNEEGGMLFYPKLDFSIGDMVKSYSI
ncbi:MAG TPA: translation initiation factor IF-2 [Candidatus Nitrosocosmicus sp.]|nr:translation initiation factor IF-2 [Candidatus Nitrosocosmicus sp.]